MMSNKLTVALIRGRDESAAQCARGIFEACGLYVEEFDSTKLRHEPSELPLIHDIVTDLIREAEWVCAVFSPEEETVLLDHLQTEEGDEKVRLQARPNVIYEAGLAVGLKPGKVLIMQFGSVNLHSDFSGVYVHRWSDAEAVYKEIHGELIQRSNNSSCIDPSDVALVKHLLYESKAYDTDMSKQNALEVFVADYDNNLDEQIRQAVLQSGREHSKAVAEFRKEHPSVPFISKTSIYGNNLKQLCYDRGETIIQVAKSVRLDLASNRTLLLSLLHKDSFSRFKEMATRNFHAQIPADYDRDKLWKSTELEMKNVHTEVYNDMVSYWPSRLNEVIRNQKVGI